MTADTHTPTAPETDELENLLAKANELLAASTELAELASYAEIVGGIHVNRPHIRKWCDRVFEIRKTLPEDENYEPAFPAADLIRLRAEVATLRASEARMRAALAVIAAADTTEFDEDEGCDVIVAMCEEEMAKIARAAINDSRCEDCPPVGYPTDKTRCSDCDRRARAALQGEKL